MHRTVLDGRTLNVRFYKPSKANGAGSGGGGNPEPPQAAQFAPPYGAEGNGNPMNGLGPGAISSLHPPPHPAQVMHVSGMGMMLPQGNGHGMGMMGGYADHQMYHPQMHFRSMRN
jgi:hypothetical protein